MLINERGDDEHTEERATVVYDAASSKMTCDMEYANNEQALVRQSSLDCQRKFNQRRNLSCP